MKHLLFFSCILILLCTFSCDKRFKPDYSNGKATALKNGEPWIAQGIGFENRQWESFNLLFGIANKYGESRQSLGLSNIPKEPGVYPVYYTLAEPTDIRSGCSFYHMTSDGDVIAAAYVVVEDEKESTVTVINYDEDTRVFSGEFRVKLYIQPNRPSSPYTNNPDTIIFESGVFEVKIEQE